MQQSAHRFIASAGLPPLHQGERPITLFARRLKLAAIAVSFVLGTTCTTAQAKGDDEINRAVNLSADDVRAFPAPPAGFDTTRSGVEAGRVEAFAYQSSVTGTLRKANVYLPPHYTREQKYPVLVLLHGIAGNQDEWPGYVRAHTILDNLYAEGKAVPMIVVMPNGRALPEDTPPPSQKLFTPEHIAAFTNFEHDLLDSLLPAIEAKYPTFGDRKHRALAGLSMGGGQALNIGLNHLDTFAWLGGFSSAPNMRPPAQLLPNTDAARPISLLYLSCGNKDGLIKGSQDLHRYLKQNDIAHVWHVDSHGHDRESWAENFYDFAQKLFR